MKQKKKFEQYPTEESSKKSCSLGLQQYEVLARSFEI
jgi:hypothetical protein